MTKTMFIDSHWVFMHFNGSLQGYYAARELYPIAVECPKCHLSTNFKIPADIGEKKTKKCPYCNHQYIYKTLLLTKQLAELFDVRGSETAGRPLAIDGVMHIGLPASHPEFETLIQEGENSIHRLRLSIPAQLMKFTTSVVNTAREISLSMAQNIHQKRSYGEVSNTIFAIAQSFNDNGTVICPLYNTVQQDKNMQQAILPAAHELIRYLIDNKSEFHLDVLPMGMKKEYRDNDLSLNLLPICIKFIDQYYWPKIFR